MWVFNGVGGAGYSTAASSPYARPCLAPRPRTDRQP